MPQGEPIPATKLEKAANSKDVSLKREAVLAENAKHFKHPGKKGKSASQPHPKTNPGFYDTEPHAPGNKIADKPLTPPPAQGADRPSTVPPAPGRFDGMGGAAHHMGKPPMNGSHGYGHAAHQRSGHLRVSGHPGGHRIGKR